MSPARLPELAEVIDATAWIDTHEHLVEEPNRLRDGTYSFTNWTGHAHAIPGDWTALIVNYALDDLVVAGLPSRDVLREDASPREQWNAVAPWYEAARATGYLRAVDLSIERLCGARLSAGTVEEIDRSLRALRREGYYEHVLRDVANIERCQVHSLEHEPFWETATPGLFDQDIAIVPLALGTSGEAGTLDEYVGLIEAVFERHGRQAVAAKCNWAYLRPLAVSERTQPSQRAFERLRRGEADAGEQRAVEDYLMRTCIDLAAEHGLPVKMHLGYLASTGRRELPLVFDHVRDMAPLVMAHPRTNFVLMHMAWPQQEQLLALAKHLPNVWVDLCWSWIVSPLATADFVQRFLTTVPATKLLTFGADYLAVENVVGHAELARRGLQSALAGLVEKDWLTAGAALALVPDLMRGNAQRLFYEG